MTDTYHTCIDIEGEAYICYTFDNIVWARIMMDKLVNMTSPPEVFSYDDLIKILDLLNFTKIKLDVLSMAREATTNGFVTVGIIKT
jgi:hypothetical protein